MIVKLLAATAVAVAPVSASAPPVAESPIPTVICPVEFGASMGSAFRVGPHLLVSAKHVTSAAKKCYINGKQINVIYTSPDADYSIILDNAVGPFLTPDCGGYVRGRKYFAIGHARGLPQLTKVELTATGEAKWGFEVLVGIFTVIPGQSGGAIIDAETGKVVGIVNVYDMPSGRSGSVALKDTPICQH